MKNLIYGIPPFFELLLINAFFSTTTGPNSTNPESFLKRVAMRRRWRWDQVDRRGIGRMRSGLRCGSGGDTTHGKCLPFAHHLI
jgi:hypothetical protein